MTSARRPFIRSFRVRVALVTTGLAVGVVAVLFVASALLFRKAGTGEAGRAAG
jgi:hypothetical protein